MIQMIFTLLLLCAAGVRGLIVQKPMNSAVSVGGSSYFNCSYDGSGGINWVFSSDGDPGTTGTLMTNDSCDIVASFAGNFRTEKPISTVCNLIVFNANLQLGGYYACFSGIGNGSNFQGILVVADTSSTIKSNVTEFIEGCEDDVFFELTVEYSGPLPVAPTPPSSIALPPLYPSFKWTLKSDTANTFPNSTTPTNKTSSSHIIVTATTPSVPSYVCTLYFKQPTGQPTNCDSSAPSYTFNWETPQINTSCNTLDASSISVTSYNESGICETKILECHPNAYPPPHDVHWLDVIRNEVVKGSRITAEFGGEYVCSVTNIINGTNRTASITYNLIDGSAFTMDKCKGVSEVSITQSTSKMSKVENVNTYSCGDATKITENVTVTCTANGLPNPTYVWYDECQNPITTDQQTIVTTSGSYKCVANNSINGRNFIESNTTEITAPGGSKGSNSADGWILLLLLLLLLLFVFPACVFLLWYGCSKSCRENVNEEFPWIEKALPCMNEKGCECSGGMVLFIFCLVICGIIFVPWILIASHCCGKNSKKSQRDSISLHERNGSRNDRHQSGASTGEAPSQAPPPRPNSMHQTQVDPFHNSHVNSPHSRPPPPSKRAMNSSSPVSASGVEYGELKIDAKPGSRKPVELIIQKESAYAELQTS